MTPTLARGDVVLVRLDPAEGREIRKTRPALVLSNDAASRYDAVVQIVPITGLPDRDLRPYEARLESETSGLDKPSRAVASQLRTVTRQRVLDRLFGSQSDHTIWYSMTILTKNGSSMALRKPVNIADAKARLPELVQRAAAGEEIIIARNGEPQARLVPLLPAQPRTPGRGAGMWEIVGDFNEPLPEDLLAAFEGRRR